MKPREILLRPENVEAFFLGLVHLSKTNSIADPDYYALTLEYLPLTTETMRLAARLWAQARQQGQTSGI